MASETCVEESIGMKRVANEFRYPPAGVRGSEPSPWRLLRQRKSSSTRVVSATATVQINTKWEEERKEK